MARRRKWTPNATVIPKRSHVASCMGQTMRESPILALALPSHALVHALAQTQFGIHTEKSAKVRSRSYRPRAKAA